LKHSWVLSVLSVLALAGTARAASALHAATPLGPFKSTDSDTHQDYSHAAEAGTFAGVTTVPAKPGELIILWATGFSPTIPTAPPGVAVHGSSYPTASSPTVTVDNIPAIVYGAALAPGSAGLYQIAIQVPSPMASGLFRRASAALCRPLGLFYR
jgi:uncharacterized protein (TIGR03437 family)